MLTATLTSDEDLRGDLHLVPLGPGGQPEDDYDLPIISARLHDASGSHQAEHHGNVIRDVELSAGTPVRLEIELPQGRRYRIGVA